MSLNQSQRVYEYNDTHRPKFNEELFVRHDDDIINALKNIILSIQRDSTFTIKVTDFEVIDDYDDINHILWAYEDSIINKKSITKNGTEKKKTSSKKKQKDNQWDFINLKDSDIKLLKVTYFLQIYEKKDGIVSDTVTVYIAIPRVINKFYYRINGNTYSAMYQIVDASTYNNTNSNSKKQTVTFKVAFAAIRTYKYTTNLVDHSGKAIPCTYFLGNMFKKTLLMMKYIFAKMGYYGALRFLKTDMIRLVPEDQSSIINYDEDYAFPCKDCLITVPKIIYNNCLVTQSAVYTIYTVMNSGKDVKLSTIFENRTWIRALGEEFASKDIETVYNKGLAILDSLQMVYDIDTRNDLKLDWENKKDIYRVLRWIMYEFNELRAKDNLDVSIKKVRYAEYIAQLYADKLARGIFRVSDKADKATLNDLRKAVKIAPMYLLNAITRCQLVTYKGCANDLDSLFALKYTYKGVSGIGEKSNAIPSSYRQIHPSHLGRVDLDSSSPSDPGVSGTICPLSSLHNSYFKDFSEPNTWEKNRAELLDMYRNMNSKITMCKIVDMVKSDANIDVTNNSAAMLLKDCADLCGTVIDHGLYVDNTSTFMNGFDIFGDGIMYYSMEE